MNSRLWRINPGVLVAGIMATCLCLPGCASKRAPAPAASPLPTAKKTTTATSTPTSRPISPTATQLANTPTLPEKETTETGWKDFIIGDFEAVHSRVNGDANEHLIFGAIPIAAPAEGIEPGLVKMLGRWEGYDYNPPVKKDNKGVLVIQQIDNQGGKAFLYVASILQYPTWVKQINFRVIPGDIPAIEWTGDFGRDINGKIERRIVRLSYDAERDILQCKFLDLKGRTLAERIEFTRSRTFYIYRDYPGYLASKRIYAKEYRDPGLQKYGWGYLLYLPEGYEKEPQRDWPLMFFLCGTGERGENAFRLAKHGPWNWILQKGGLPFIIVAPMLYESKEFRSFPEMYMSGALDEILADYRVDPKRVYLTGLSMGGEATYRFALYRPEAFAAIAPFAAFDPRFSPGAQAEGFKPLDLPMSRLKNIPVWAFHGAVDPVVPLAEAQKTVDALKQAGVEVRFTILADHDHDAWSEAFLSQAFYDWLLQHSLE
jgi:predicted esterase